MKRIISVFMMVCFIMLLIATSIVSSSAEVTNEFEQEFVKFCLGEDYDNYTYGITYKEYYRYFSENNDTDVPDWIFGEGYMPDLSPAYAKGTFGDYCIYQSANFSPFVLGCFVYVPSENKFYDIIDAWDLGFENLEYAFAECAQNKIPGIYLVGDANADGMLSIMDATHIQLAQASLDDYRAEDNMIYALHYYGENLSYISDFDRDGERTILDATEIQLHLAGLDEEPEINEEMVYSDFNNMYGVDTGIEDVAFETLYNGTQDFAGNKIHSERFAVIIKSKEQFGSVFYSDYGVEDYINDEFFEDNWLVASACRVTDAEMVAEITDLGVRGNTLFMRADKKNYDTDGLVEPIAPMYHSFVAVDKEILAQVTEIIWL